MEQIQCLTDDPRQKFQLTVENNTLYVTLYFYQTQKSWFMDIEYNEYVCKGLRVVLSVNTLRQMRNILPFGIMFECDNYAEPYALDDFSSGRIQMFILSQDEVNEFEEEYYQ